MRKFLWITMPLLSACATANAQSPYPHRSGAERFVCRDTGLAQFRGNQPSADIARQILTVSGAKTLRWVPKGAVITMELREDRATVWLDSQGRIERAACS